MSVRKYSLDVDRTLGGSNSSDVISPSQKSVKEYADSLSMQGVQGVQGAQGEQGVQGTTGVQGSVGAQGTNGTNGEQGVQGIQGIVGLQGLQGIQGSTDNSFRFLKTIVVTTQESRIINLATLYNGVTYTESCIEINSDVDASITVNALSLYKNTFVVLNTTGNTTVNFLFNMQSLSYGTLNCSSDYVNSFYEISVPVLPTGARVVEICKVGNVMNVFVSNIHMDTILTPDDFIIVQNALQDYDGNYYDGLMVNGRLWMASNLRTKHYADGTSIPLFSTGMTMDPYYAYPSNNPNPTDEFFKNYGLYYNWNAVMKYPAGHTNATSDGTTANPSNWQGVAPNGWHIPSLAEWSDFFAYIANKQEYNLSYDSDKSAFGSHIAKAVCSKTGWVSHTNTDAVGNNQALNNATGFNIFPAGRWSPTVSRSDNVGSSAYFWSTAPHASTADNAWGVYTYYDTANMGRYSSSRFYGFSVRCVQND